MWNQQHKIGNHLVPVARAARLDALFALFLPQAHASAMPVVVFVAEIETGYLSA